MSDQGMIAPIKNYLRLTMNYRTLALTLLLLPFTSNVLAQEPQINTAEVTNEVQPARLGAAEPTAIKPITMKPQARYVADEFYVPLRETPCARCKIVHRGLKTGTKLMLVDLQDGWGLVKTEKGVEGWMEEQFLSDSQIARVQVVKDKAVMKKLKRRNNELEQVMSELRQQSKSLRGKLDSTTGSKENLALELANIKEISSDAIALNKQNQELVKQSHMLQRENDVLKANFDDLQKDRRNESFLYGGLTVFLGAILVVLIPKLRGRKRFSEWQ
jgi:SH3 domain protein